MSQAIYIPDDTYTALKQVAEDHGQTIEELVQNWVADLKRRETESQGTTAEYNPALDPLAEYLGAFEAISPDDVERHDEFFGASGADTSK